MFPFILRGRRKKTRILKKGVGSEEEGQMMAEEA